MLLRELLAEIHHVYGTEEPLKKGDTITVYHGYNNYNDALLAAKHGLSGGVKVPRVYSYESDNNPKGLFVTPKFKTATEFSGGYKLSVILEFDADLSELEAPVWPGGSWTGFGGYSQYFGWGAEGRAKRNKARKEIEKTAGKDEYAPEYVKVSDNPHLADMLLNKGEPQALYVGHLNPNRIKAFHVRELNDDRTWKGEWTSYSREEFLQKYSELEDKKHKPRSEYEYKMFSPDEEFSGELFKQRLQEKFKGSLNLDGALANMWKMVSNDKYKASNFKETFGKYLWPKQLPAAFNWLKRTYGTQRNTHGESSSSS